jgi:hypothetical protein
VVQEITIAAVFTAGFFHLGLRLGFAWLHFDLSEQIKIAVRLP